jgi:hypothetical protein
VILQGIDNVGIGIWMAITGGPMSHFGSIPISAIFYPLLLIPSRIAQIILSCFTGVLFFHTLPPTMFENPNISSNAGSFIIDLVLFLFLLRRKVRNSFYLPELNGDREEIRARR